MRHFSPYVALQAHERVTGSRVKVSVYTTARMRYTSHWKSGLRNKSAPGSESNNGTPARADKCADLRQSCAVPMIDNNGNFAPNTCSIARPFPPSRSLPALLGAGGRGPMTERLIDVRRLVLPDTVSQIKKIGYLRRFH
ncbi:unnamed protein product, partial [Iphiclides podalirius]